MRDAHLFSEYRGARISARTPSPKAVALVPRKPENLRNSHYTFLKNQVNLNAGVLVTFVDAYRKGAD